MLIVSKIKIEEASRIKAVLWNMGSDEDDLLLNVILGPKLKTKDEINISKSSFEHKSTGIDFSQYDFVIEVNKLRNNCAGLQKAQALITDNFD